MTDGSTAGHAGATPAVAEPDPMRPHATTLINVFGGPGIGKSTFAALLFAALKVRDASAEIATEYAKDLLRDGRGHVLSEDQIEVFAAQRRRHRRLVGKVDLVVTDSPVLLCSIYAPAHYPQSYHDLVRWAHDEIPSVNLLLQRHGGRYEVEGRIHSETVARAIDQAIVDLLDRHRIPYHRIPAGRDGIVAALGILETTGLLSPAPPSVQDRLPL
jgi:nicotinamide riboside kinase